MAIKIVVIGNNNIAQELILSLRDYNIKQSFDVVIIGRNYTRTKAVARNIREYFYDDQNKNIIATDSPIDFSGAAVIAITAGASWPVVEFGDRLAELPFSAQIITQYAPAIKQYAPDALIVTVTNPLDIFTWHLKEATGFSPYKVVGIGVLLDSRRHMINIRKSFQKEGIVVSECEAVSIGPHSGRDMVLLRSSIRINGESLADFILSNRITEEKINTLLSCAEEATYTGGFRLAKFLTDGHNEDTWNKSSAVLIYLIKEDKDFLAGLDENIKKTDSSNSEWFNTLWMSSPPTKNSLNDLPTKSNAVYVLSNNKLFYVNKAKKECIEIKLDEKNLALFDALPKLNDDITAFLESQLMVIPSMTGHTFSEISALVLFLKIFVLFTKPLVGFYDQLAAKGFFVFEKATATDKKMFYLRNCLISVMEHMHKLTSLGPLYEGFPAKILLGCSIYLRQLSKVEKNGFLEFIGVENPDKSARNILADLGIVKTITASHGPAGAMATAIKAYLGLIPDHKTQPVSLYLPKDNSLNYGIGGVCTGVFATVTKEGFHPIDIKMNDDERKKFIATAQKLIELKEIYGSIEQLAKTGAAISKQLANINDTKQRKDIFFAAIEKHKIQVRRDRSLGNLIFQRRSYPTLCGYHGLFYSSRAKKLNATTVCRSSLLFSRMPANIYSLLRFQNTTQYQSPSFLLNVARRVLYK